MMLALVFRALALAGFGAPIATRVAGENRVLGRLDSFGV